MINMIDEKDPHPDSVKADSSDDEVIIDLTEEVIIKTENDNAILELTDDLLAEAPKTVEKDKTSEIAEDDGIIASNETEISESRGDGTNIDRTDQIVKNRDDEEEDQLIASAIAESLGADQDEDREVTEEFNLNASDEDDTLIIEDDRNVADENLSAMAGDQTDEANADEDLFDLEEEIELEYELDDDEDELIDLDEERDAESQEFIDLLSDESMVSDPLDGDEEPMEFIDLESVAQDDLIDLDADRDEDAQIVALAEDEAPEFSDSDDLPDLEAASELDFEGLEDEEGSPAVDEFGADSSDDIIARAVEQSLGSDDDPDRVDLTRKSEFEMEDEHDLLDLDHSQEDDEEILALAEEEPLEFERDDDLLDLDEGEDLEADDEVIPLDGLVDRESENDDDIIEITEFDQHFPTDGEALLKQSGILDTSGADEDDFLELIDIEQDHLSEDEEIDEFSDPSLKIADDRLNQFFSDDQDPDESKTSAPKTVFSDDLDDKWLEDEAMETAKEAADVNAESKSETEALFREDENFEFNFDPNSIAQQVDRLDSLLSDDSADEPEVASLPVDQDEEDETEPADSQADPNQDELLHVPPGQIDAAIERVINEKFSGKIEDIIYEVIEKAVAKEIDRLKGVLTGNNQIDDDQH